LTTGTLTLPYYYHFDDQFFLMFPRKVPAPPTVSQPLG
jgi:hypothetical protein